jgi:hypothetical protein
MLKTQPTQEEVTQWLNNSIQEGFDRNVEALEKLREGDYYGDPLPDSMADIAKSLRIISGREKLD